MKNIFGKKILSLITSAAIVAAASVIPVSVMAFDAPAADTGAAGGISNGGEWTIYASKAGQIRSNSGAIADAASAGLVEVTSGTRSAALQFDLSTKDKSDKVIKSANLRLTPMVSKNNLKQNVSLISDDFTDTTEETQITQFDVPRVGRDNFFDDTNLQSITTLTEYPAELANWQANIDITGEIIAASDNTFSLHLAYANGNSQKTEYATCNIAANGRLNGGRIPFLYNNGTTDYSKWIYPQIVFTYTDEQNYKTAYADFISANTELSKTEITETNTVSAPEAAGGSAVTLEAADNVGIVTVKNNTIAYNPSYAGSAKTANIRLTVTNGEASYSKVVAIPVNAVPSYTISFNTDKNPVGEASVTVGNEIYTDGTAYAKEGGKVTVNPGSNVGYTADIKVTKGDNSTVETDKDGSFVMPAEPVSVSIEYAKAQTFGTSRIAAINSASVRNNGQLQSPDLVIGADRITFVKFDLSGYNKDVISDAQISFSLTKASARANAKAVFYVPNNDWTDSSMSTNFSFDGTDDKKISSFKYTDADEEKTISLYNGENHQALIIPNGEDASSAANGILKDFYITSTGTRKTCSFSITDAVKTALGKNTDGIVTFMLYSTSAEGGNDVSSVQGAPTLAARPSLTITESAEYLPDESLITEIKTVEDLETFTGIVNGGNSYSGKTVTLANDIDLSAKYSQSGKSWTPIGTQDIGGLKPFAGTFDGGNHSITGLYINENASELGLFGAVTGAVKNLTVTGEITGSSVIGGIAAWCSGSITDCHSRVNITAQREAGGIAGTLAGGGTVSASNNTGNITVLNKETYAGGIAGHNIDSLIDNCENSGKIENGSDGFRNRLGGIVGFLDNGEIRNSRNSGAVVSDALIASYTSDSTQNYVGGVAGYSSYGTITDSSNSSSVNNAVDYAGGIAGMLQYGNTVSGCTNSGSVSGRTRVGGIAGCSYSDITDCHNNAEVTGVGEYTGGVAGNLILGNIVNSTYDKTLNSGLEAVGSAITAAEITYADGKAVLSVTKPGKYTLVFAAYDAQDVLLSTEITDVRATCASTQKITPQTLDTTNAKTVKAMLINRFADMRPAALIKP